MSNNATKIDLYLKNSNGDPRTNTNVLVRPIRGGFWSKYVGLVEDTDTVFQTDENGYVQMELWPLPYPYTLTYSDDDEALPGQFLFYVPDTDSVVDFQTLIVTKADSADKYGETVLADVIQAKTDIAVMQAAVAADKESIETSESNITTSETNAANSATAAAASLTSCQEIATSLQSIYTSMQYALARIQAIDVQNILLLGGYYLWVDSSGDLRISDTEPTDKDTDGTVVGTQS